MNYNKKSVLDADVRGKKVLLRCDFNVPQNKETGAITSDKRIVAALPTIKYLLENGAAVIACSHLVRRNACGGCVCTVHRAESVGDIDLGHVGKSLCKVCAVFLLTDIKAQVLKQHYLARLQRCGLGLGVIADDIVCKNDLLTEKLGKALGNGSKRQLRLPLSQACSLKRSCR